MSLVASVQNIQAADIIRTAEQLQKQNLKATEVNINVFNDHISIVDPNDQQLISYIKRNQKTT